MLSAQASNGPRAGAAAGAGLGAGGGLGTSPAVAAGAGGRDAGAVAAFGALGLRAGTTGLDVADATGLVDAALLADRQVHRQVQKRIGLARGFVVVAGHGGVGIRQVGVVFGVLGDPQAGQSFDGFHGGAALGLGVYAAQKAAHIGLGGAEHGA